MNNSEPKNQPVPPTPKGFGDIEAVLPGLLTPDLAAASAARTYAVKITMPPLPAELLTWMAAWQGKFPPQLNHPRVVMFASDHGMGAPVDTKAQVDLIVKEEAPICKLAEEVDADLRLYDLGLSKPTADITTASAMDESECVSAIIYGMMAVEMGLDIITLSAMGRGSELAACAIGKKLGYDVSVPRGEDQKIIEAALARHAAVEKPLELLAALGGREMAAMLGVMIAARMARTPLVIEGINALVTAALLHRMDKRAVQHCLFVGSDDAAMRMTQEMGLMHVAAEKAEETGMAGAPLITLMRSVLAY